jgi:hypothetical protein
MTAAGGGHPAWDHVRVPERSVPALRWPRALALASVATTTGVAAHGYADGLLPSVAVQVVIFALCTVGVAGVLGGPASTLRVVLLTVGGQAFIHAALTMTAGHRGDGVVPAPAATHHVEPQLAATAGRRSGSLLDQYDAARAAAGGTTDTELVLPAGVRHLLADLTGAHAMMMVLHLLAAALVGLWLAAGEHALWALVALAAGAVLPRAARLLARAVAPAAGPGVRLRLPVLRRPEPPPRLLHLAPAVVRRGPPALLAA